MDKNIIDCIEKEHDFWFGALEGKDSMEFAHIDGRLAALKFVLDLLKPHLNK